MKQFMKDSKKVMNFLDLHIINDKTRRQYEYHLRLFFERKKVNDIDKYIKDPRLMNNRKKIDYEDTIKNDILDYWKYINNEDISGFHGKTPYVFLTAIRRFLEANNIIFSPELWRIMRKNGHGNFSKTDFQTPSKPQLKDILSNADCEAKALFLMQMTSGQRIETILNLTWNDVEIEHEYPRIFIRNQKGKRPIHTRITTEAKEYLLQYKSLFPKILETREKRTPEHSRKPLDKTRIFPMSKQNVERMWNTLTEKVGLYIPDKVTQVPLYGTHCLRRYFQQNLGNENDALYFMGKKPENIATYLRYKPDELDRIYIKGAENLVVFKEKSDLPDYLNEYDDKFKKMDEELKLSNERNELYKQRLATQEDRLKHIEHILTSSIQDRVAPWLGSGLTNDESDMEDKLYDKVFLESERRLKELILKDPKHKDDEIIYIDRTYDHDGNIRSYGRPILQSKKTINTEKPELFTELEKLIVDIQRKALLDQLSKYDTKTQRDLLKQANQLKKKK